jgi:hypothetical protein
MSQFIRCPECSFCIGLYMNFIDKARQLLYIEALEKSEYKDYDPDKLTLCSGVVPPLEDIYNALSIKNRCCRTHILAALQLDKLYK